MTQVQKVVIAGYARSAFARVSKKDGVPVGELVDVRPDDLAAQVVNGLLKKTGVDPNLVQDLNLGCAMPEGEQGWNLGHIVVQLSDLPKSANGDTLNKFCGSSMKALHNAAGTIATGMSEAIIVAGVDSMSRVEMGGFNPSPNPDLAARLPGAYMGMGETAENVARRFNVSREDQDAFALRSQQKAEAARIAGKFDDEIIPIVKKNGQVVDKDSVPRAETTLEGLARLKPAFAAGGSVTAGTSSPITDGATALLVCSEAFARANGLNIMAEIVSYASAGCDPEIMGMGPVAASEKALKLAGLTADQMDVVEINEAFASQSIASLRQLGIPEEKVNKHGGAIALGHPLGATGARIVGKAAQVLNEEGGEYALVTQCIGGGQGISTIIKRYSPSV